MIGSLGLRQEPGPYSFLGGCVGLVLCVSVYLENVILKGGITGEQYTCVSAPDKLLCLAFPVRVKRLSLTQKP